jgi:glutamine synthetase
MSRAVELEFMNFRTPAEDGYTSSGGAANIAAYLETHSPRSLQTISNGMFGYSVTRPAMNKNYFRQLSLQSKTFNCAIEGLHTESGPGVIEAVRILYCPRQTPTF